MHDGATRRARVAPPTPKGRHRPRASAGAGREEGRATGGKNTSGGRDRGAGGARDRGAGKDGGGAGTQEGRVTDGKETSGGRDRAGGAKGGVGGADVGGVDEWGNTALEYARSMDHPAVVAYLEDPQAWLEQVRTMGRRGGCESWRVES